MIMLNHYLMTSAILFLIGAYGVLTRRNIIMLLLSAEVMLNAVNLSFVAFAAARGELGGQLMVLFVIAIAAAEVAVGLAIAVLVIRGRGLRDPNELGMMKW